MAQMQDNRMMAGKLILSLVLLLSFFNFNQVKALSVTTVAGNTKSGNVSGVKGIGRLKAPFGIVKDSKGNFYVLNSGNTVSKIDIDGNVTVIAGSDSAGFADGTGQNARFSAPQAIAIDTSDNIYIADTNNHRIRKLNPTTKVVTTIAGDGSSGFADGPGASAQFKKPQGIAVDSVGNVYVADTDNRRIRKIATDLTVSTYAGTGANGNTDGNASTTARFKKPTGLVFNSAGELIVADRDNRRIRKIHDVSGTLTVTTIAGSGSGNLDGTALSAKFSKPNGLAYDPAGNLYISDTGNHNIRKLDTSDNVSTVAGAGTAGYADGDETSAYFDDPTSVLALSNSQLLVTDKDNHSVRLIGLTATYSKPDIHTIAGRNAKGATNGVFGVNRLSSPGGTVFDTAGNLYIADAGSHRIRKLASNGSVSTFAGTGTKGFADGNGSVAQFHTPRDLVIDASGNLYVADDGNHRIRKITPAGIVSTYAGNGTSGFTDAIGTAAQFKNPKGLAIDSSGVLYVADYNNHRVRSIATDQTVTTIAGNGSKGLVNGPLATSKLNGPINVAVHNGMVFIADYANHAIRKTVFDSGDWIVSTFAGGLGQGFKDGDNDKALFSNPSGLALNTNGAIFVADRSNQRIRMIKDGVTKTLVGSGLKGFLDANGSEAQFTDPERITFDSSSNLIVSDTNNHRLRKVIKSALVPKKIKSNKGSGERPPIVFLPNQNLAPIIKLVSDIEFDASNTFTIREGTKLKLLIFVYDIEDGFNIEESLTWVSSLQGRLASGVTSYTTETLQQGLHHILVRAVDSADIVSQTSFSINVVAEDEDLGDDDGGGADRNGDGIIDENDREVVPQETTKTVIHIKKPKRLKVRKRKAKLNAVALQLDDSNSVDRDFTDEIIWEKITIDPTVQLDPGEIPDREFIGQGSRVNLRDLQPGVHTIYARVNDDETKVNVTVTKRKIIFDVIEASSVLDETEAYFWGL